MIKWLLHLRLLRSAQLPWWACHVAGAGSRTAGPNDGTIDTPQVVVDSPLIIQFVQQGGNEANPGAVFTPTVEELEHRLPGAVAFREITPGGAGVQDPQDAVEQGPRIVEGMAHLTVVSTVWQQGGNALPLFVREFVAAHDRPRLSNHPLRPLPLSHIILLQPIARDSCSVRASNEKQSLALA